MKTVPKAVVFDIGNVLIEWRPERFYDLRIGVEARKRLFDAVDLHGMNDRIDRGEDFLQTVRQTSLEHPEFAEPIMMWHDHWIDIAAPVIESAMLLAGSLRKRGTAVFILSNIGQEPFRLAAARDPRLEDFDRIYLSGGIGAIKPESEIYRRVEEDCGIPPERLLFTDDRAENLAAAAARGWRTHLFRTCDEFARTLVAAGLLPADPAKHGV